MTALSEAIARYNKILESPAYKDLSWAAALHEQMKAAHLVSNHRTVSPVLRPHFLTQRQYASMAKAAESLTSAIERVEKIALETPALLARMQLLPAEKMLASIDPGYSAPFVTSLLDTHLNESTIRFVGHTEETPAGVVYGEALADVFYDAQPVKEFRKKYKLTKLGGAKHLLAALLKTYKQFGGKQKKPHIAILEFRAPMQGPETSDCLLLAEYFRREGHATEIVTPDQLEYRNGALRRGDFTIDLVYRRLKVQEFLVRFDLGHPLVRAYKDRAVCLINSFRSELGRKKAIFDLLTDETVIAKFPAAERHAIEEFVPWTRVVNAIKTNYNRKTIDLPDFILQNRSKLILKPNDDNPELHSFRGSETDDAGWERALRQAMRTPYVVQEVVEPSRLIFPLYQYGSVTFRDLQVDVHPHSFLGKVHGASTWLSAGGTGAFSTLAGLAPTYILGSK